MTAQTRIPLTRLSPELSDRYGAAAPGYRKLYMLAMDGQLRTELVNGRHYVLEANLPAIAADLGLVPAAEISEPTRAPRAPVEHVAA